MISGSGQPKHHYHPLKPPCVDPDADYKGCEQRISQIVNNTIFGKISNLLCQERDKVSFFQTTLTS
jgi:hypothetical protein